jgi:hypothetical protein
VCVESKLNNECLLLFLEAWWQKSETLNCQNKRTFSNVMHIDFLQMIISSGQLRVMGSMAVVTQQAWIFNDTVRENILFGLPFDESRYQAVVECCCLQRDLELLVNGDKTEISEGGSNLR